MAEREDYFVEVSTQHKTTVGVSAGDIGLRIRQPGLLLQVDDHDESPIACAYMDEAQSKELVDAILGFWNLAR